MMVRPAAFGAATFHDEVVDGTLHFSNFEGLGGEVLVAQTVPRAEACGATVLLTRIKFNTTARFGIDAAYVTGGVYKRARLETGKTETSGPCCSPFSTFEQQGYALKK